MCQAPGVCQTSANSGQQDTPQQRIDEALSCACVSSLKAGPCGRQFVTAFTCFHKSTAVPKGCDCLEASLAFSACLQQHPHVLGELSAARAGGLDMIPRQQSVQG